jgi:molybdopterin/thiamine biosynthesis adenylyltransferase
VLFFNLNDNLHLIQDQLKLKSKKALIVGCGGLGCPSALYLSSSGIGTLGLLDHDHVEITNIHRQIAHDVNSIGSSKALNLANRCKSYTFRFMFL